MAKQFVAMKTITTQSGQKAFKKVGMATVELIAGEWNLRIQLPGISEPLILMAPKEFVDARDASIERQVDDGMRRANEPTAVDLTLDDLRRAEDDAPANVQAQQIYSDELSYVVAGKKYKL